MKRFTYISTSLLITVVGLLLLTPLLAGIIPSDSTNNFTSIAHAQDSYEFLAPIGGFGDEIDVSSEDSFPQYVQTMITTVIGFAILAAIVLIVMAGFKYMTTTSKGGVDDAKIWMKNAVLGLILALASVVILQTINPDLVELNSVQTVTTSGSSFAEVDPLPETEFGGSVHAPEDNTYGDQHCFYVSGVVRVADLWGGDPDDNRYICYNSENECQNNQQKSEDYLAAQDEKDHVEGGEGRVDECKYYFESTGELVYTEGEEEEVLFNDILGVGESKSDAVDQCEENVKSELNLDNYNPVPESYSQCVDKTDAGQYSPGSRSLSDDCKIQCAEPKDEPDPVPDLPKDWNEQVWCSTSRSDIGENPVENKVCWNKKSTCEGFVGDCYRHPSSMTKNGSANYSTSCDDCVFLQRDNYDVRNGGICSPTSTDDFCRINSQLSGKLSDFDSQIGLNPNSNVDGNYEVTEAFPPTVKHSNVCHYQGTCVDAGLRKASEEMNPGDVNNRYNNNEPATQIHADKVVEFIEVAESNGLRVVYEVGSQQLYDGLVELGVPENKIEHYEDLAPHFSVYNN